MPRSFHLHQVIIFYASRDDNGVTVGASTFIIKFVPPDYEKTDEDIAREKNGTIQISYGSDTIEESSYASATFMTGGAQYTLLAVEKGNSAWTSF